MSEKRYGMLIDLAACIGCNACAVACKQENGVELGCFNVWVESWDVEEGGSYRRVNVPKQCNHCADAPCVAACTFGATYQNEDGVVLIDAEKCTGCGACVAACPFGARYQIESGEAQKCTFCYHRVQHGMMPACAASCVTKARYFGDMNDPESDISKKLAEVESETLYPELGLDLAVRYVGLSETLALPRASAIHKGGNVLEPYTKSQE